MLKHGTKAAGEKKPVKTIADLWNVLDSDDGDREANLRSVQDLPRLATIAANEFSSELDLPTLELLRGLLASLQDESTDRVDNLKLSEAAELLETAALQSPSGRLIDQTPGTCAQCGGQLSDEDRAWREGWCADCRSHTGKVIELDIAFKTESLSYDQFGGDPLDRFAEWPEISTYICNRYSIPKVDRDHWERFLREIQAKNKIVRDSLLAMSLIDLVARLDLDRQPNKVPRPLSKLKEESNQPERMVRESAYPVQSTSHQPDLEQPGSFSPSPKSPETSRRDPNAGVEKEMVPEADKQAPAGPSSQENSEGSQDRTGMPAPPTTLTELANAIRRDNPRRRKVPRFLELIEHKREVDFETIADEAHGANVEDNTIEKTVIEARKAIVKAGLRISLHISDRRVLKKPLPG
jgi:hypothetical protein